MVNHSDNEKGSVVIKSSKIWINARNTLQDI